MSTRHVVVDLETLSTRIDAVVTSIGIATLDPTRPEPIVGVGYRLRWDDQLGFGRRVSQSTLRFWLEQDRAVAQRELAGDEYCTTGALYAISPHLRDVLIWGNGAAFDLAILRSLYEAFDLEVPWNYRNERCFRTLRDGREPLKPEVPHDPVSDAVAVAKTLQLWLVEGAHG